MPLCKWRMQPAFFGVSGLRGAGVLLIVAGMAAAGESFVRFALEGCGTPAPISPTEKLVISGPYRYVWNPMYVGVLAAIAGQALLFGSTAVLVCGAIVALCFQAFVRLYEEPTLRREYGSEYEPYCARVPCWWPRINR